MVDTDSLVSVGVAAGIAGIGLHIMSKGIKAVKWQKEKKQEGKQKERKEDRESS